MNYTSPMSMQLPAQGSTSAIYGFPGGAMSSSYASPAGVLGGMPAAGSAGSGINFCLSPQTISPQSINISPQPYPTATSLGMLNNPAIYNNDFCGPTAQGNFLTQNPYWDAFKGTTVDGVLNQFPSLRFLLQGHTGMGQPGVLSWNPGALRQTVAAYIRSPRMGVERTTIAEMFRQLFIAILKSPTPIKIEINGKKSMLATSGTFLDTTSAYIGSLRNPGGNFNYMATTLLSFGTAIRQEMLSMGLNQDETDGLFGTVEEFNQLKKFVEDQGKESKTINDGLAEGAKGFSSSLSDLAKSIGSAGGSGQKSQG